MAIAAGINLAYYKGDAAYLHIKYAPNAQPTDAEITDVPGDFVGFCASVEDTAPTTALSYTWARINSSSTQAAVESLKMEAEASAGAAAASEATAEQKAMEAAQSAAAATKAKVDAKTAQAAAEAAKDAALSAQTDAESAQSAAEMAKADAEIAKTGAQSDSQAAQAAKVAAETAQTAAQTARDAAQAAQTAAESAQAAAEAAQGDVEGNAAAAEAAKTSAQAAQSAAETAKVAAQAAKSAAESAETNATARAVEAEDSASAAAKSAAQAAASAEAAGSSHPSVNIQPDGSAETTLAAGETFLVVEDIARDKLGHVEQVNKRALTLPQSITYSATIGTSWTGSEAPYSQVVSVEGIQAADGPIVDIVQTGTEEIDAAMREAWAAVTRITTSANSITVCAEEPTETAIPIQIKVVR